MRNGPSGARIDGVGIASSVALEVISIVAGCSDRAARDPQHPMHSPLSRARRFDANPPGRTAIIDAASAQIPADIHQVVHHPLRLEPLTHLVDGIAFGDGGQIHVDFGVALAQRRRLEPRLHKLTSGPTVTSKAPALISL